MSAEFSVLHQRDEKIVVYLQPLARRLHQDTNWGFLCEELCEERTSA